MGSPAAGAAGTRTMRMRPDLETSYRGMTALVVGAARSGIASAEFLLSSGARVILTDSRDDESLRSSLAALRKTAAGPGELILELGGHQSESFTRCDFVVVSPGVPASLPHLEESRRLGIPIIPEVELAYRHLKGTIIGITGSNGKTTTTVLVAEILQASGKKARVAGNIGLPLIGFVASSQPGDIFATELSSFQLECLRDFRPHMAAILNLSPDHMDRHRSFEDYMETKRRIFLNQGYGDVAVLNRDDARTSAMAGALRSIPLFFSRRTEVDLGAFVKGGRVVYRGGRDETDLFDTQAIQMKGAHNLENVLAACTMALTLGAPAERAAAAVLSFKGLEHRLEWVAEIDGVQYFNDSKATNVDAALKSLEAFPGNVLMIAGGRDKGGDFSPLRLPVAQRVKHLVLIGEAAGKIGDALGEDAAITRARTLPEAVALCRRLARPGDVVLLAPACASFDMFRDFEERGRVFKNAVHEIGGQSPQIRSRE